MILLLMEQDDCIMAYFLFQEKYGIKLYVEKQEKDYRGARKGARNLDVCRYWVPGGQEGHPHLEFIISRILRQRVSGFTIGWYKYWIEQRDIHKHHQVWATPGSYEDFDLIMLGCDWMDYMESGSWE